MATSIKIQVWEVRGPWTNVIIKGRVKGNVVGIVSTHFGPRFSVTLHTAEPHVFPGMWQFPADTKKSTGGIKLIAVQLEVFPENRKRVNNAIRRGRFELVVKKAGVGFFSVKGGIVGNQDIARADKRVEILHEAPVISRALFISRIIGKGFDLNALLVGPSVGIREYVPVLEDLDDVRFPNEVKYLKSLGGKIVRLERFEKLNIYGKNLDDPSETSLDGYDGFDHTIDACWNTDIPELHKRLDIMMQDFEEQEDGED